MGEAREREENGGAYQAERASGGDKRVFYDTGPSDFHNSSIRFTNFEKGKITSVGKLHRDVVTVNSSEVNWKTQVIMAK